MDTRRIPAVLFLLSSLGVGGSETKFVRLAGSLASRGMRVIVAYLNPPEHLLRQIDRRVTVIALNRRGRFSVGALRRLVTAIRDHEAETVVAVNLYAALYGALARWWLGRKSFRFLVSSNTTHFVTAKHARQMQLYSHVLRTADVIIFGAESQRRLWCSRYGLAGGSTVATVLYNGVDTDRFAPRKTAGDTPAPRPATRYVIGTVGTMRIEKAQTHLVRAIAELRLRGLDVGALIVGDGTERGRLADEIERYGLQKHVLLTGMASDVRPFLELMDVFVLPSIGVETFSNAALEALSTGIPVVSAAVGGMEELLSYGGGVTYPPGDVARLSDLLAGLLPDVSRRRGMSEAGRRAALERFGYERMVDSFTALLPREESHGAPVRSAPRLKAGRPVR